MMETEIVTPDHLGRLVPARLEGEPNVVAAVDYPWSFDDGLGKRGAQAKYKTMAPAFEFEFVERLNMAADSLLFMWRVSSQQRAALDLVEAWGYTPHSELVWCKETKTGKEHFGMGRIVRGSHESLIVATRGDFEIETSHETCLIARRGKPVILSKSVRSRFSAPVPCDEHGKPIHSAKPDEFFALVEPLLEGPRVELFARKYRDGWTGIGDELVSTVAAELDPDDPDNW